MKASSDRETVPKEPSRCHGSIVFSSKPGLRRILVGPDATVVVVLAAIVEGSELEVVIESEVVSPSVVVGWDKRVVDVSVS